MSFEELIRSEVEAAVDSAFAKHAGDVAPLTYSIPEAAIALGTSAPTVRRLVGEGHLPLVPHMGERKLIPRAALDAFVNGSSAVSPAGRRTVQDGPGLKAVGS